MHAMRDAAHRGSVSVGSTSVLRTLHRHRTLSRIGFWAVGRSEKGCKAPPVLNGENYFQALARQATVSVGFVASVAFRGHQTTGLFFKSPPGVISNCAPVIAFVPSCLVDKARRGHRLAYSAWGFAVTRYPNPNFTLSRCTIVTWLAGRHANDGPG